jgi:2-oxoglutarate dehydrogenase E1 component
MVICTQRSIRDWTRESDAKELDPASYGLSDTDRKLRVCMANLSFGVGLEADPQSRTVDAIIADLQRTYAASVGVEVSHLRSPEQLNWIYERLEASVEEPSDVARLKTLETLSRATLFEAYCGNQFAGVKRFGLEGCESLIVGLDALIERAAAGGVEHVVMGMPHRGRLNVLANTLQKPVRSIFREFRGGVLNTPADQQRLREKTDVAFARYDVNQSGNRPWPPACPEVLPILLPSICPTLCALNLLFA